MNVFHSVPLCSARVKMEHLEMIEFFVDCCSRMVSEENLRRESRVNVFNLPLPVIR